MTPFMGINIDELLKILPQLIRENDTVKGAILTALSGVIATREDILNLGREMDKRFEAVQNQMDKRFEAVQNQMDKRFEAVQNQMDKRFDMLTHEIADARSHSISLQKFCETNFKVLESSMDRVENAINEIRNRFESER